MDALENYLTAQVRRAQLMDPDSYRAWLLSLEQERLDQSWKNYRKPTASAQPVAPVIVQRVPKPATLRRQKERDRIMYHAGRFAQGARDQEALEASRKVKKYIEGK